MKFLIKTCAAIAAAATLFSVPLFSACDDNSTNDSNPPAGGGQTAGGLVTEVENEYGGVDYVFTITDELIALDFNTSVYDYLVALQGAGEITFVSSDSGYGQYITSVGGVAEKNEGASGYSWMVYTDLAELDGVIYSDASYGTWDHNDKTLNSASYGISSLPAVEGYTFALVYSMWSY